MPPSSAAGTEPKLGSTGEPSAEELGKARALLDSIDARVFAQTAAPTATQHVHEVRAAARRLFGHGR